MIEKILIFGNGQIGNFYQDFFSGNKIESKIAVGVDITDFDQVVSAIKEYQPTTVINTAAKTNLEYCSNNKLDAFNVNVLGADNIAKVCDNEGIYFIHFSSGCIFSSKDENDKRKEDDPYNPTSYYSWTKVWAEQMIQFEKSEEFKFLILRPRQPISTQISHMNMLVKFLTLTKFVDTPNTGTAIEDLMEWTKFFIETKPTGTLHVANDGWSTPLKIAGLIKKHILPELPIEQITKEELNEMMPNTRIDTVMDVTKLKEMGVEVRDFEEALEDTIIKLGENIKKADKKMLKEVMDTTMEFSKSRTVTNDVWSNILK